MMDSCSHHAGESQPLASDSEQATDPCSLTEEQVYSLYGNVLSTQGAGTRMFESSVAKQGVVGNLVDFLKNNVGGSAENRSWYHPMVLWSHVLSWDNGSDAIGMRVAQADEAIEAAGKQLDAGNANGALKTLQPILDKDDPAASRTIADAERFDQSQASGVEAVADMTVLAAYVIRRPVAGWESTLLYGALLKPTVKGIDYAYSDPLGDFLSGAILPMTLAGGRAAGRRTVPWLESSAWGSKLAGLAGGTVSYATEGGVSSGAYSFSTTLIDGLRNGVSPGSLLIDSATAGVQGTVLGAGLGLAAGGLAQKGYFWPKGDAYDMSSPILTRNLSATFEATKKAEAIIKAEGGSPVANKEARKVINEMLDVYGLPRLKAVVVTELENERGIYRSRHQTIKFDTKETTSNTVGHEVTHHEQRYLWFRLEADELGIGTRARGQSYALDTDAVERLGLSKSVMEKWLDKRAGIPLTAAETRRANWIRDGWGSYADDKKDLSLYLKNPLEVEANRIGWLIDDFTPYYVTTGADITGGLAAIATKDLSLQ